MDKTEGVLKNFLKKGQKGQSMDSWFHKLPFSNHWEWTYAYFIFVKHYKSLPYFKSKNVSYRGQHSIIEFFHMQHSGKAICVFTPVSISILIFLLVYTL